MLEGFVLNGLRVAVVVAVAVEGGRGEGGRGEGDVYGAYND